jgi:hypothetical protein
MSYLCDWCGEPIAEGLVTLEARGHFADGRYIFDSSRHFHAGKHYDTRSCLRQALGMLDGEELSAPDAGFEWRLVPVVEWCHADRREGMPPVLGHTPLADLGLGKETYMALTRGGVHTVEHAADMRGRGDIPGRGVGIKRLERLDRALVERGYLGSEAVA